MSSPRFSVPYTFTLAALAFTPALSAQVPHPEDSSLRLESAMLWTQSAGEWRALCYQGWNIARVRLDALLNEPRSLPPAVIVDIDETILDNSPFHAQLVLTGDRPIPVWSEWIDAASAETIPGALEFLRYADSRGVTIFYVTNRGVREKPATLANLRKHGFPQVESEQVLERTTDLNKESRRSTIRKTHDILLLCGDNLADFAEFDGMTVRDRNAMTDRLRDEFGSRFIVFPNTFVGDWQAALYRDPTQPGESRETRRRKHLRPWTGR